MTAAERATENRYEEWKVRVNVALIKLCEMGADDLPDYDYRDAFDMGVSPSECARLVVQNARNT